MRVFFRDTVRRALRGDYTREMRVLNIHLLSFPDFLGNAIHWRIGC